MFNWLKTRFFDTKKSHISKRERLEFDKTPPLIYAIGDVHGCLDLLQRLEKKIFKDIAKQKQQALIIMLGDYVDRGENSSGVLDYLMAKLPKGVRRLCLVGNHEETMLAFIKDPKNNSEWLKFGGKETLVSYGFELSELKQSEIKKSNFLYRINSLIPSEHVRFLSELPIMINFPSLVFVHAGIRPELTLNNQLDEDLIWIREDFIDSQVALKTIVVHGHTPTDEVYISKLRINIDTGAYAQGKLSAVKFINGKAVATITC